MAVLSRLPLVTAELEATSGLVGGHQRAAGSVRVLRVGLAGCLGCRGEMEVNRPVRGQVVTELITFFGFIVN